MDQPFVDGATPLDPDEAEGLIPDITTQAELNEWEQANIAKAVAWLGDRSARTPMLSLDFVRELHRRMFDETWEWAGQFRKSGKNIGIPAEKIPEQLDALLKDATYWLEHATYPIDEIGARLHHRLVWIHAFANGNGRHARLFVDAILRKLGVEPFTWGSGSLTKEGETRRKYIAALRSADNGDCLLLLKFVRS